MTGQVCQGDPRSRSCIQPEILHSSGTSSAEEVFAPLGIALLLMNYNIQPQCSSPKPFIFFLFLLCKGQVWPEAGQPSEPCANQILICICFLWAPGTRGTFRSTSRLLQIDCRGRPLHWKDIEELSNITKTKKSLKCHQTSLKYLTQKSRPSLPGKHS